MNEYKPKVIVMNSDPQVLRGLTLLLQDMGFDVTAISKQHKFEVKNITQPEIPALLVIENGKTDFELVNKIRVSCDSNIPVVVVHSEDTFDDRLTSDANTIVLSDRVKPAALKQKINEILLYEQNVKENSDGYRTE